MMKCPVCGNKYLYMKSYYEPEFGLVEVHVRCSKCEQFSDDWAYGRQEFFLNGKSWDFTSHPFVKDNDKKECIKCWKEI